ncbi:MAG: protease inhibitor I42 family protein [Thermodesulfobacteriota bacterium]
MRWSLLGMSVFGLVVGVMIGGAAAWAESGPQVRMITDRDQGSTFTLPVGARLTVQVRNPADGGYTIVNPVFDGRVLKLRSRKDQPPDPARPRLLGDFGKIIFEMEVIGDGSTDLIIQIARPWEKDQAPQEFLKVRVNATR